MAIRKFRKGIKPFVWVISIAFILGGIVTYFTQITSQNKNIQNETVRIRKENIQLRDIEMKKLEIVNQYQGNREIEEGIKEYLGILSLEKLIEEKAKLEIADKLKIKVTQKEINERYDAFRNSEVNKGKSDDEFRKYLSNLGHTRATLKEKIGRDIRLSKVLSQVTEREIIEKINELRADAVYNVKDVEKYQSKVQREIHGIKIYTLDIAENILSILAREGGTKEEAIKKMDSQFERDAKIIQKAKKEGIEFGENFTFNEKIFLSKKKLFDLYMSRVEVQEEDLEKFFKERKTQYDQSREVSSDIVVLNITPSNEDKIVRRAEVKKILENLTPENFPEHAKKYSKDVYTADKGGDIGWFTEKGLIPEISQELFKGEVGKIYPKIFETQGGYHIIKIAEKREKGNDVELRLSQIYMTHTVSDETRKNIAMEGDKIVFDLNENKIKLSEIKEKYQNVVISENINLATESDYLNRIRMPKEFVDAVFAGEKGVVNQLRETDVIFIYRKTDERDEKIASLSDEEVRNAVIVDYKNKLVIEMLNK